MSAVDEEAVIAALVREPFCMAPDRIGRLTYRQLALVYARDPKKPKPVDASLLKTIEAGELPQATPDVSLVQSYRDVFYGTWRKRDYTDAAIDVKWQEYQREQGQVTNPG